MLRPNKLGHIETPFYKVYKGQIQQFLNPSYNIPFNESNFLVAPADINVFEYWYVTKYEITKSKKLEIWVLKL